jgi:hypothetical protein
MSQMDNGAPRRIRSGFVAAAVLMLGLYAAPAVAQDTTQVEKDTAAYAPAPAPAAENPAAGQVNVELTSVASSGIEGTAVLAPEGDGDTDIEVTLRDSAGNEREYDVTLRAGTCAEPGEVIEKIDDTEADGDPEDEGADLQLAAILATPHIIHVTEEGGDAAVACGEIKTAAAE